ncbi:CoA transferase [Nocardioides pacificus]
MAGPLCAHLLGLDGARVVKVESTTRPDGARRGPAAFFELLHAGHAQLTLDLATDVDVLRELVARPTWSWRRPGRGRCGSSAW